MSGENEEPAPPMTPPATGGGGGDDFVEDIGEGNWGERQMNIALGLRGRDADGTTPATFQSSLVAFTMPGVNDGASASAGSDPGGPTSDSEGGDSEPAETVQPILVPTCLESVRKEDMRKQRDRDFLRKMQQKRGVKEKELHCLLCEIDDGAMGDDATNEIHAAFALEKRCRRTWKPNLLFKAISTKLNAALKMACRSTEGRRLWGGRRVTVEECRRHFKDGHDNDATRSLWQDIDYINDQLDQLRRENTWEVDALDTSGHKRPNLKNHDLALKLYAAKQSMIKTLMLVEREQRSLGGGARRAGTATAPKSSSSSSSSPFGSNGGGRASLNIM